MEAAAEAGLAAVAMTDHGPTLPDAPHLWHFQTMLRVLPETLCGVRLLKGAEANAIDFAGGLDLPARELARMDFVVASMHTQCLTPGTFREHTETWLALAANPLVDCLGHSGQPEYPYDHDAVVRACRDSGCLIEINNNSFSVRPGSRENCLDIAARCAEHGVPVAVNSDAHWAGQIGRADEALALLAEIGFPEELILNADRGRLAAWFARRKRIAV
jgi:putative hydrolase